MNEHNVSQESNEDFLKDMENHPAFATNLDDCSTWHPATEALQALKFESEDPCANALSYKEEGNYYYEKKKLEKAISSYTTGIRVKAPDPNINALLYTNRALCHFYLKNYRSCINDCKTAVNLKPDHLKAYLKGVDACIALCKVDEALILIDKGLKIMPDTSKLKEKQLEALKMKMKMDQNAATLSSIQKKKQCEEISVYTVIKNRGIQINFSLMPVDIPQASDSRFYVDSLGKFHWPVLFMYPEFGQTDFFRDVVETSTVCDCLTMVFNPDQQPPSWDPENLYTNTGDNLEVYFEDTVINKKLVQFSPTLTIRNLSTTSGFTVRRDLFIIIHVVAKRSVKFYEHWKSLLD